MKFYLSKISVLFDNIENGHIKALLLYGPDKGYINKICNSLVNKYNLLKTSVEYNELKANSLDILANSQNFFKQRQLIKVRSVGESIDKSLKLALNRDYLHFLVFIADELSTSSSIRKFFENEDYLASLACYHDDEQKITKIILHKCASRGKTISTEAVKYLSSHLKGDHLGIINEINKLIYFSFDIDKITINEAQNIISNEFMANGDNLCAYFVLDDLANFLQEFNKLIQQNINEVLIIRALIRYYLNLYIVLSKLQMGVSLDLAIKSLTPPIFYKYEQIFRNIISKINLKDCTKIIKYLRQAEIEYKLNPTGFDIYQQVYLRKSVID